MSQKNSQFAWWNLVLCLFLSQIIACGKESTEKPGDTKDRGNIDPNEEYDFQEYAKTSKLECPTNNCPTSVVKILSRQRKSELPTTCTGLFVSNKTILTSAQCIPDFLSSNGQACGDDIYIVFRSDLNLAPVKCDEVKKISLLNKTSDPASWGRDYALLTLKNPVGGSTFLAPNAKGLQNGEAVSVVGVVQKSDSVKNHTIEKFGGCKVLFNSYVQPFTTNEGAPVFALAGCELEKDMSLRGSVIFDSKGEAKALFSTWLADSWVDIIKDQLSSPDHLAEFSYAFNYACIPFETGWDTQASCRVDIGKGSLSVARQNQLGTPIGYTKIKTELEKKLAKTNKYMAWKIDFSETTNGDDIKTSIVPNCFRNRDSWIEEFNQSGWFNGYLTSATKSQNWPVWTIKKSFDEYLRVQGELAEGAIVKHSFRFSPKQLKKEDYSFVDIYFNASTKPDQRYESIRATCN